MRALHASILRVWAGFMVATCFLATQLPAAEESFNISAAVALEAMVPMALEAISQENRVPVARLRIVNRATAIYPIQNRTAFAFKAMDTENGAVYGVTMDADGHVLDPEGLASAEQAAFRARYGRFEPEIFEYLKNAPENEQLDVLVWAKEPAAAGGIEGLVKPELIETDTTEGEKTTRALFAEVDSRRAEAVRTLLTPLTNRVKKLDANAVAAEHAPVISARLSKMNMYRVAEWADVDMVYLDRINKPELNIVRAATYAREVHQRGITGTGVRVAQIEAQGGRVTTANPNLAGVVQDSNNVCTSSHSTGVAGIIRSTHATYRGIAFGAILWTGGSCDGFTSELNAAATRAVNWGARALNLSWGENINLVPGVNDRFYDSIVINNRRSVVKSAGNEAPPCNYTSNVTSPGLAYNVITVGNFNDRNTAAWKDDAMNSCSSWRDPASIHGDREKPELAAPGTNIRSTTDDAPWTGSIGSGTSYAAPVVTGAAALLIRRNARLASWPEAIKAILMVTARHNIEGAARLSEKDGAGGVDLRRADSLAAKGPNGKWGARTYNCDTATPLVIATMPLEAGRRTRAAIVWDTDPTYASYAYQPCADLDLQILSPTDEVVAASTSWDNTYEIIDFKPAETGDYKLRVTKRRCSQSPKYLGWAWNK